MTRKSALERELEAKTSLAITHGISSWIQVPVHDTLFHVVEDQSPKPYVSQSEIREHFRLPVIAHDRIQPLGFHTLPDDLETHSAQYFYADDILYRTSSFSDRDIGGVHTAVGVDALKDWLMDRVDASIRRNLDNLKEAKDRVAFRRDVMDPNSIDGYASAIVRDAGRNVALLASQWQSGFPDMAPAARLPYHRVSASGKGHGLQYSMKVSDDRSAVVDNASWEALALGFEFWEADLALEVASYGSAGFPGHGTSVFRTGEIDFDPAMESYVAMRLRVDGASLLPSLLKRIAMDTSKAFRDHIEIGDLTSKVFSAVTKNEWANPVLPSSLDRLDGLEVEYEPFRDFVRSLKGDIPYSPFTLARQRVETFPWFPKRAVEQTVTNGSRPR